MLKTKKNYFDFNNNYDKLRDAQDADKMTTLYKDVMMHDISNEIKPDITKPSNGMLSPVGDTTYDTNGIPTTKTPTLDTDFKWIGDGATAKFEDKLAERNKLNNEKWGNYGTGTLFGADWKFNDNAGDIVRNEYEQAKSLNTNFEQQYQQTLQRYKDVAAENDRASQKAYIQKQQNLRNANTQARAMGRGGLGITESGYRRTDNNYNNQVTELDNQTNRNLNMTLNDYLNYANNADNSARINEENAKIKYGDYLIENIGNYLEGAKNGSTLGALESSLKDGSALNYGGDKKVGSYYDKENEQTLLDYLNSAFDTKDGKDNYFLDGKSHNDIQQRYKDAITSMGSGNTGYGEWQKEEYARSPAGIAEADAKIRAENLKKEQAFAEEQRKTQEAYKLELEKAHQDAINNRGMFANVSDSQINRYQEDTKGYESNALGVMIDNAVKKGNHTNSVKIGDKSYNFEKSGGSYKVYNSYLKKNAPDKVAKAVKGDVIVWNNEKYILDYDGNWNKLVPKN